MNDGNFRSEAASSCRCRRDASSEENTSYGISASIMKWKSKHILPSFLRRMKKLKLGSLSGGNALELLSNGDTRFSEFIAAIESAQRCIDLETYIFNSDDTGWEIAKLLAEKSASGVEVNLIYDAIGCISTSAELFEYLKKSGVEIVEYHPIKPWRRFSNLGLRDHRKILIVDGMTAFLGGSNIGDEYAGHRHGGKNWRDTHLRVTGPAVADIQFLFIENWYRNGGAVLSLHDRFTKPEECGDKLVMVLGSKARKKSVKPIMESYLGAIDNAQKSILITNAYFVPTQRLYHSLISAVDRGVDVRVMVPAKSDIPFVKYASHYLYKRFLKRGVHIFEYQPTMLHAKTAVIDNIWSTVGSSNLDGVTLMRNLEINAVILDQNFGEEMQNLFADDLKNCREIILSDWNKRSLFSFLLEWLCYHLMGLL